MRPNALLRIEFITGTDILEAAEEARDLAEKLNIGIQFKFNDVECTMWATDRPTELQSQYHEAAEGKKRMAFGR